MEENKKKQNQVTKMNKQLFEEIKEKFTNHAKSFEDENRREECKTASGIFVLTSLEDKGDSELFITGICSNKQIVSAILECLKKLESQSPQIYLQFVLSFAEQLECKSSKTFEDIDEMLFDSFKPDSKSSSALHDLLRSMGADERGL